MSLFSIWNQYSNQFEMSTRTFRQSLGARWLQHLFDIIAQCWLFVCAVIGSVLGIVYVNPAVFLPDHPRWKMFNEYLLYYGLVMFTINWMCSKFTNTKPPNLNPQEDDPDKYDYCTTCHMRTPARAHHCPVCNRCVTGRDHHCFFSGTCIGSPNQRYFLVWTFWLTFGCTYGFLVLFYYTFTSNDHWKQSGLSWVDVLVLPLLPIKYIVGIVSMYDMCIVMLLHCTLIGVMIGGSLFAMQLFLASIDKTSYEYKQMHTRFYKCSPKLSNVRRTFNGWMLWPIEFLLPFGPIWSALCVCCRQQRKLSID